LRKIFEGTFDCADKNKPSSMGDAAKNVYPYFPIRFYLKINTKVIKKLKILSLQF